MTTAEPQTPVGTRWMPHASLRCWATASLKRRLPRAEVCWDPRDRPGITDGVCLLELVVPVVTPDRGYLLLLDTERLRRQLDREKSGIGPPLFYASSLPIGPGPLSFRSQCMGSGPRWSGYRSLPGLMRVMRPADILEAVRTLAREPITPLPWPGTVRTRRWTEFWSTAGKVRVVAIGRPGAGSPGTRSGDAMTVLVGTPRGERR
ncbi:hypothetical protein [Amycolatopsis sp. WAC 04197]|uniref:hypothetical protein n=1 Tax=Amycolatopsis sp. WAC 04197 TaxID=2203199 RepID=UPI001315A567|nr:hypothetical protein [Amycolatopsis sp. WAC 04197]